MPKANLRGQGANFPSEAPKIGMPTRAFLFTVDQLSVMLDIDEKILYRDYLYYEGRSIGSRKRNLMLARNIAPKDSPAEWRVAEREFIRWMKHKGFRHYERGSFPN